MSAVAALHFDPVFGMGSRQTYSSWPVIKSNQHSLFGPDLSSNYVSDTSVSPPSTSRSITGSPPHYSLPFTPQEREFKRRQNRVRRHEKIISRQPTSDSNIDSILTSDSTSPKHPSSIIGSPSFLHSSPHAVTAITEVTMTDLSSSSATGSLPGIYTSSAPSQMSLMSAESVATTSAGLNSPSYYSPSMHDNAANQGVFSTPAYQNQQYMPEYTTASFSSAAPSTLHSQYPRTAMPDQPSMVYPMHQPHSSIMGAGHMHQQHQQPPQHHQQAQQQVPAHHSPLPHPMSQQHRLHHHSNGSGHHQGQNSPPLSHSHAHAHSQAHPHGHVHPHAHSAPSHHHPHSYDGVVGSAVGAPGSAGVRQSRPKPQCWEHGCNGRQFSTFSNLLRHQREKSGQAAKAVCPNCGAEFTRTTARNGHLQHDKCKQRQRN